MDILHPGGLAVDRHASVYQKPGLAGVLGVFQLYWTHRYKFRCHCFAGRGAGVRYADHLGSDHTLVGTDPEFTAPYGLLGRLVPGFGRRGFLPGRFAGQVNTLPTNMQKAMVLFNVCGISVFVLVIVQLFVIQRNQYQEQSDTLLLNILPREIANILRSENRVIADAFEGASILFADVVNFTPMSASMTPVELVNLLNEVFSHFDVLAEKHQLEKIKTIGDCYMVA